MEIPEDVQDNADKGNVQGPQQLGLNYQLLSRRQVVNTLALSDVLGRNIMDYLVECPAKLSPYRDLKRKVMLTWVWWIKSV